MRYLFLVQGEGRGHMTQALALADILKTKGHELVAVVVGKCPQRAVPDFFIQKIGATVYPLQSPNFAFDKDHKTIRIGKTIAKNIGNAPIFLKSLRQFKSIIKSHKPDYIINFYDWIGGLYGLGMGRKVPMISIGHQYLAAHPSFPFPPSKRVSRLLFKANNWLTGWGSQKMLALSFAPLNQVGRKGPIPVPPLLRKEIFALEPTVQGYILVYMVNPGYANDVIVWHQQHPGQTMHCFWDNKEAPESWEARPGLTFHRIDDQKFLKYMAGCSGYVTTAGFESVCEAAYLGKPIMMVPVAGHYEQSCNALDAAQYNIALPMPEFDIGVLLAQLSTFQGPGDDFKNWVDQAQKIFIAALTLDSKSEIRRVINHELIPVMDS